MQRRLAKVLAIVMSPIILVACKETGNPPEATSLKSANASATSDPTKSSLDFGSFCGALAGKTILDFMDSATTLQSISAGESNVVVNDGTRVLKALKIDDCGSGSGVTIRFTEDVAPDLSGFEVFVRNDKTLEVVGLAVDAARQELSFVPSSLAFDKARNKTDHSRNADGSPDQTVYTRMGCFACHSKVSLDCDTSGAQDFWQGATAVRTFAGVQPATGAEQNPPIISKPPQDLPPGIEDGEPLGKGQTSKRVEPVISVGNLMAPR